MSNESEALIEKCRAKYQLVATLERERDDHKDKAKALDKTIDNTQAEIRRLLTESNQMEADLTDGESEE